MKSFSLTWCSSTVLFLALVGCGTETGDHELTNPFTFETFVSDENAPRGPDETEFGAALVVVEGEAPGTDVVVTSPEEEVDIVNEDGSLDLVNTEWVLTSYINAVGTETLAEARVAGKRYTLNFMRDNVVADEDAFSEGDQQGVIDLDEVDMIDREHDSVSGFATCNRYGGNYIYNHPVLSIDTVRITDQVCQGFPFTPEFDFYSSVLFDLNPISVSFADNRLILSSPAGNQLVFGPPGATDEPQAPVGDQCLTFSDEVLPFGDVTLDTLRQWYDPLDLAFDINSQNLSNVIDETGDTYIRIKLSPTSSGSTHVISAADLPSARTYLVSQSIMFETGFDWGGTSESGKFGFGLGGGSTPSGGSTRTDGFTLRYIWRGNGDGSARLAAYSYASDRMGFYPFGEDYPIGGFPITPGEWFTASMEITVNSDINASDGAIKVWVNGELLLDKTDIQWWASGETPDISRLFLSNFHGGNSAAWAPAYDTFIRVKDVCISGSQDDSPMILIQ